MRAAAALLLCAMAAGSSGAAKVQPKTEASITQLKELLATRYSHREVRAVDWDAQWQLFTPRLHATTTPREFAVVAGELLAATRDPHIWLTEAGEIVPAFRRQVAPNANIRTLSKLVTGWQQPHRMVALGLAAPRVGYLAIHSWERRHAPQLLEAALAALDHLRPLPALIIDVRFNSGGDERLAREFAQRFVAGRVTYAKHRSLGATADSTRWIEPVAGGPRYTGRVAVLTGPYVMSSCESFVKMMRQAPGCRIVGARTYGASGNPQPHTLANGVTVLLPSWRDLAPDGSPLETHGLAPDLEVTASPEDFVSGDPVLAAALQALAP